MDCASASTSEEELRGVSIYVELIVRGDDFEAVINDILAEDGGASFLVSVTEPAESWVDAQHQATRCWRVCLFMILIFQD